MAPSHRWRWAHCILWFDNSFCLQFDFHPYIFMKSIHFGEIFNFMRFYGKWNEFNNATGNRVQVHSQHLVHNSYPKCKLIMDDDDDNNNKTKRKHIVFFVCARASQVRIPIERINQPNACLHCVQTRREMKKKHHKTWNYNSILARNADTENEAR